MFDSHLSRLVLFTKDYIRPGKFCNKNIQRDCSPIIDGTLKFTVTATRSKKFKTLENKLYSCARDDSLDPKCKLVNVL